MKTDVLAIINDFPLIFANTASWSNKMIQASRIDQALCDEAEAGRAHGDYIIDDGCMMLLDGQIRCHLNQGFCFGFGQRYLAYPLNNFAGGLPLIETAGPNGPVPSNGCGYWQTQFPYLRASVLPRIFGNCFDPFGVSDAEYQQAVALGGMWGLSGNWGDPNRLGGESNWPEDDSLLTTYGDSSGCAHLVYDARGIPQYAVELIPTAAGTLLLPYRYLKRVGFWGPRRVFFPPEENIAVWYKRMLNENVKNIILTDNPDPLLRCNTTGDTAIGCLPGGAASVNKTDTSTLQGRECWIPVCSTDLRSDVEFAVTLAARLRREYQNPHIVCFEGNWNSRLPVDIGLSELCQLAVKHKIFVPEELRGEYLGDLTDTIAKYVPSPIIDGVLNAGEIVRIAESDIPPLLLATHVAKQLDQGCNIFGKLWCIPRPQQSAVIIDRGSTRIAAQYSPLDGVKVGDCRFIDVKPDKRLQAFFAVVGSARVIIITASELIAESSDFCLEILHQCINRNIAVIIFSDGVLSPKLNRKVSRAFTASCIDGKNGLSIAVMDKLGDDASVEVTFDASGALLDSKELSESKRDAISPARTIPALSPDKQKNEKLKELPITEKMLHLRQSEK